MFFRGTKPKKNPNRPGSKQDHFAVGLELESGKHLQPRLLTTVGTFPKVLWRQLTLEVSLRLVGEGGGTKKTMGRFTQVGRSTQASKLGLFLVVVGCFFGGGLLFFFFFFFLHVSD